MVQPTDVGQLLPRESCHHRPFLPLTTAKNTTNKHGRDSGKNTVRELWRVRQAETLLASKGPRRASCPHPEGRHISSTMGKGVCRQGRGHDASTGVRSGGRPGPPIPGSSSLPVTILTSSWGDSELSLPLSGKAWAALGARPGSHFSSSLWRSSSAGEHQQQEQD